ncbi:MAG: penicillin-binding transpeptidase domain-containing protein [Jatrophihabitantaceae bacterium]
MRSRPLGARRFTIIVVLVASMVATLLGRLYYVQLLDPNKPHQTAGLLHPGAVVIPAPRGLIVDSRGRVLVDNTPVDVMTIDQDRVDVLPDHGAAVLRRVAELLHMRQATLAAEITPCSPRVPAPCWTGEPYQPVPVAAHLSKRVVLTVSEHREDFPGVAIQTVTLPTYPHGALAGHVLGYTAQITAADKRRDKTLTDADTIGVSGLQQEYDSALRGVDGSLTKNLSPQGYSVSDGSYVAPVQGDTLVTSIDLRLQRLAEQSLARQIADSRKLGKPATSGAVVAMDPQTGRILAVASYPDYNPQLFVGGISAKNYRALTAPAANDPLLSRAIAGQYAPGSTFKLITTSSLVTHKEIRPNTLYGCPGSVTIDGRVKTNYESEVLGNINLRDALGYSCDTYFYAPAANEYYADQNRIDHGKPPHEWLQRTASAFGVGRAPNIDLPASEQASGSYADRESRLARWRADKAQYCAEARSGYRNVRNLAQRSYLTELSAENCTDGWRYRAGDNADMSIGQGETTMSPLQLAVAYSALVNGGRIWSPRVGWAVVDGTGKTARAITPTVRNKVPASQRTLDFIARSLNFGRGWAVSGAFAYLDSPYASRIGGKTGTAEVHGKQDTSWLATWGPIYRQHGHVRARFVLVGMVEQGGTGATAAGPMLKRIWDALLGANGTTPIIAGERPATTLPRLVAGSRTTR